MNWYKIILSQEKTPYLFPDEEMERTVSYLPEELEKSRVREYPLADKYVDGLLISDNIPNMSSIGASLYDYKILKGVREVPFSAFYTSNNYGSSDHSKKVKKLIEEINNNNYIDPLIVVIDDEGPYILEGSHRFDALVELGKKSFPALVVLDLESKVANELV